MIHICGIDIGLTGGFTRFEMDTSKNTFQCTESIPTPTHIEINYKKQKKKVLDIASILNFFQYHKFDHIVIEHVHAMPGNGNVSMFNFGKTEIPQVDGFYKESKPISVGSLVIKPIHAPGHSPGSFCLHVNDSIFVGDVLFKESIGRTDLYGGSYPELIHSIRTKLFSLPDSTKVFPGHGPSTTIGLVKISD
jgi:hypothetical protein